MYLQPDDLLVNIIRQRLPVIYDCSDFVGRSEDCFEDQTLKWVQNEGMFSNFTFLFFCNVHSLLLTFLRNKMIKRT
jgi:hypothetical protein